MNGQTLKYFAIGLGTAPGRAKLSSRASTFVPGSIKKSVLSPQAIDFVPDSLKKRSSLSPKAIPFVPKSVKQRLPASVGLGFGPAPGRSRLNPRSITFRPSRGFKRASDQETQPQISAPVKPTPYPLTLSIESEEFVPKSVKQRLQASAGLGFGPAPDRFRLNPRSITFLPSRGFKRASNQDAQLPISAPVKPKPRPLTLSMESQAFLAWLADRQRKRALEWDTAQSAVVKSIQDSSLTETTEKPSAWATVRWKLPVGFRSFQQWSDGTFGTFATPLTHPFGLSKRDLFDLVPFGPSRTAVHGSQHRQSLAPFRLSRTHSYHGTSHRVDHDERYPHVTRSDVRDATMKRRVVS